MVTGMASSRPRSARVTTRGAPTGTRAMHKAISTGLRGEAARAVGGHALAELRLGRWKAPFSSGAYQPTCHTPSIIWPIRNLPRSRPRGPPTPRPARRSSASSVSSRSSAATSSFACSRGSRARTSARGSPPCAPRPRRSRPPPRRDAQGAAFCRLRFFFCSPESAPSLTLWVARRLSRRGLLHLEDDGSASR